MRSIFELITKYKSDVIIVPIIAFAAFIVTLFLYIFLNKRKFYKYIPGLVSLVIGLVMFIQGFFELLSTAGLDFVDLGAKFLIFASISILLAIIFDVVDSLASNIKSMTKKSKPRQSNKERQTLIKSSDEEDIFEDDDLDEDVFWTSTEEKEEIVENIEKHTDSKSEKV